MNFGSYSCERVTLKQLSIQHLPWNGNKYNNYLSDHTIEYTSGSYQGCIVLILDLIIETLLKDSKHEY